MPALTLPGTVRARLHAEVAVNLAVVVVRQQSIRQEGLPHVPECPNKVHLWVELLDIGAASGTPSAGKQRA